MSLKTTGLEDDGDDRPVIVTQGGSQIFHFTVNEDEETDLALNSFASVASSRSPKRKNKRQKRQGKVVRADVSQPCITACFRPRSDDNTLVQQSDIDTLPNIDLALVLLGNGNNNYDRLELKGGIARNGADLPIECFVRAGIFLKMFAVQGVASREIGTKMKHKHLHVAFYLRYPSTQGSLRKLKTFFRDFILGLPSTSVQETMPEYVKENCLFYDDQSKKDETSGHRVWLNIIKNSSDSFHLQTGYLMKDLGAPHFMLLSYNMSKRNLVEAYKNYVEQIKHEEPDKDKTILMFNKLPTQLREFQTTHFGKSTNVNVALVLFWYVKHCGAVFDEKFMTGGRSGGYFDHDRLQAWLDIRTGKFTSKDIALVAFGDASFASGITETDESLSTFESFQEQHQNETEGLASGLVNGDFPSHTAHHELTTDFLEQKTDNRDRSLVYALLCGHSCKTIAITTSHLQNGSIAIEQPVVLAPQLSVAATTSQRVQTCSICGIADGHNRRSCKFSLRPKQN